MKLLFVGGGDVEEGDYVEVLIRGGDLFVFF